MQCLKWLVDGRLESFSVSGEVNEFQGLRVSFTSNPNPPNGRLRLSSVVWIHRRIRRLAAFCTTMADEPAKWGAASPAPVLLGRRECSPVLFLCARRPPFDLLRHLRFGGPSKQATHCLTCLLCHFPPGVPVPIVRLDGALRNTRRGFRCSSIPHVLVRGLLAFPFPSWLLRWHLEANGP